MGSVERINRWKTPPLSLLPFTMLVATKSFHPRGDAMRCCLLTLIVSITIVGMTSVQADHRRYGNPWHGAGMYSGNHVGHYHGGYGHGYYNRGYRGYGYRGGWGRPLYGYGGFGFGGLGGFGYSSFYSGTSLFGPGLGYGVTGYVGAPIVSYPLGVGFVEPTLTPITPGVYTPFLGSNPLVNDSLLNNGALWQQEVPGLLGPQVETLGVEPLGETSVLPAPSSPQAQLRGVQLQEQGDTRLRDLDYLQASMRYQDSIGAAADRVEPHYRLAITQAGMKRFDKAVRELKLATQIDPTWVDSITLDELLGDDNLIGKTQLKQRVADWALADAHDADRLYLLGTLLYLDGNQEKARILFDTAVALVGNEPYLAAFLTPLASSTIEPQLPEAAVDDVPPIPAPPAANPPEDMTPTLPSQTNPSLRSPAGPVFPSRF